LKIAIINKGVKPMRRNLWIYLAGLAVLLFAWGCKKGSVIPPEETEYTLEELIQQGWAAFEQGQYLTARDRFDRAWEKNPLEVEVYNGLGWSYFKLDSLEQATRQFHICYCLFDTTADIAAGWAFVLNAQKHYEESNEKAVQALALNAAWAFTHALPLDVKDLRLLKAENYYLLGNFTQSLAEVKILNPAFPLTTVASDLDRAALAAEIERLKGII